MPVRGPVLALDLAREYGWCSGEVGDELRTCAVGHGIFGEKRDASTERVFAHAFDWLSRTIPVYGHGLVVFEAPLPPPFKGGFTNVGATRMGFGLAAITEAVCCRLGIEVREARVADVRDHFIQTHKLKRKDAKPAVWERCKMLGLECKTMDESDAAALWHYMCAILDPRTAARSTPLFAKVAGR